MAGPRRRTDDSLADRLFRDSRSFDFFQAVRILERLGTERDPQPLGAVGEDHPADREAVAFRVAPSLSFATSTVAKIENPDRPELTTTFFGLTGPDGILPAHYTALLIARVRQKDPTLGRFLDLFHHRLISLLVRAWKKNRLPIQCETHTANDAGIKALTALVGLGTAGQENRSVVPDGAYLHLSGFFARHPRTALGLEGSLSDYFGLPVKVEQLVGQWLYLDAANRAAMPSLGNPEGLHNQLGRDATIGHRLWDVQCKVRLAVGPLDRFDFESLMPQGAARKPFDAMVRQYLGLEYDVDLQLLVRPEEVPWLALDHDEDRRGRLGHNTWLRSQHFGKPVGDAIFAIP
jgi:type VI secretion system protein ImpH